MIRVAREAGSTRCIRAMVSVGEPGVCRGLHRAGLTWIGPPPEIMRSLGNKVSAREMAVAAGTPVTPATGPLPEDPEASADGARRSAFR